MIQGSIARRYAKALMGVAGAEFEQVAAELDAVGPALLDSREATAFFRNPSVPKDARAKLVEAVIAQAKLSLPTANLLRLLNDRGRMPYLPQIARAFGELADERAGRLRAKVSSAHALPPDFAQRVQAQLAALTKKNVALETATDPGLLGGLVAQVGNVVYDGSLRSQLESMRSELLNRA